MTRTVNELTSDEQAVLRTRQERIELMLADRYYFPASLKQAQEELKSYTKTLKVVL